jgi:hypothetical protein
MSEVHSTEMSWSAWFERLARSRRTWLVLAWLLCISVYIQRTIHAWTCFDTLSTNATMTEEAKRDIEVRQRADGNQGHIWIDFGGQWVFARTLYLGYGKELYHRQHHWRIAKEGYPLERQSRLAWQYRYVGMTRPESVTDEDIGKDYERLLGSMMGDGRENQQYNAAREPLLLLLGASLNDNPFAATSLQHLAREQLTPEVQDELARPVIGGPLYPPTHPLLYYPLGAVPDPQLAYRIIQGIMLLCCLGCGWCVRVISRGRIWWPIATTIVLMYPGMRAGIDLGQNNALTVLIVLAGWALAARGYAVAGGSVWGLLAFKPVWGLAFILVPLVMRRWRFVFGTAVAGLSFVLLTLPLVGVQSWLDWWFVGREAAALYNVDQNWINLSRDISGLPKRFLVDFTIESDKRNTPLVSTVSSACLLLAVVGTAVVYLWRGNPRRMTGLSAAFLLFGAYLCCYRFMYYDSVLSLLGFVAYFADPREAFRTPIGTLTTPAAPTTPRRMRVYVASTMLTLLAGQLVIESVLIPLNVQGSAAVGQLQKQVSTKENDGKDEWKPKVLSAAFDFNHPFDTGIVVVAWLYCGFLMIRDPQRDQPLPVEFDPRSCVSAEPMSGERIKDSPTSTA